jgi:hypothetical protein
VKPRHDAWLGEAILRLPLPFQHQTPGRQQREVTPSESRDTGWPAGCLVVFGYIQPGWKNASIFWLASGDAVMLTLRYGVRWVVGFEPAA